MQTAMGVTDLLRALARFAATVRENHELLTNLDCAAGDGDHGTTMLRGAERIEAVLSRTGGEEPGALLDEVGWEYIGLDGGASGPLVGSMLVGMGAGCAGRMVLDARGVAEMFEGGVQALEQRTKAKLGDKTMLDALIPGTHALRLAADQSGEVCEALERAADAAQAGAEKTKGLVASFGRAKNLGERTLGCQDPGATTIALFFRAFSKSCGEQKERNDG